MPTAAVKPSKPRFDAGLIVQDAAARGWSIYDLADFVRVAARKERVRPPSLTTVYRFVNGGPQTPRIAGLISKALEKPIRRYLQAQQGSEASR